MLPVLSDNTSIRFQLTIQRLRNRSKRQDIHWKVRSRNKWATEKLWGAVKKVGGGKKSDRRKKSVRQKKIERPEKSARKKKWAADKIKIKKREMRRLSLTTKKRRNRRPFKSTVPSDIEVGTLIEAGCIATINIYTNKNLTLSIKVKV